MATKNTKAPPSSFDFTGTWHIYEMSNWDESYFNMEVQAFIEIDSDKTGEFHFGLVFGSFDWKLSGNRLTFNWEGNDEMDEASGRGWLQPTTDDEIEGEIKFRSGDSSLLKARRAELGD